MSQVIAEFESNKTKSDAKMNNLNEAYEYLKTQLKANVNVKTDAKLAKFYKLEKDTRCNALRLYRDVFFENDINIVLEVAKKYNIYHEIVLHIAVNKTCSEMQLTIYLNAHAHDNRKTNEYLNQIK